MPLGGLGEVGKNMTVIEADEGLVVIDAGLAFPRDEHLGVDLVLPDFGYLREQEESIRAIILTHGHEDHVGALPYVMREVRVPRILAARFTLGLVKSKLDEHGLGRAADFVEIGPDRDAVSIGPFSARFVRVAHSIPDALAVVLDTPGGRIVHTGDYKIDHTPVDGFRTDVTGLAALGEEGVDLLLGDSTNAERPGFTPSERRVGEAFREIIPQQDGRVLIASFASNVHRMQQAMDVAVETGRRVCVVGRSLRKNLNIARNLGYVDMPADVVQKPADLSDIAPCETMILCTGSQGEPLSALTRIAYGGHPHISVDPGDTVIISAKAVPGNELRVHDTINQLTRAGATVLHEETSPIHVSGHGNAEELRMMLGLLKPRAVMPVHGEFRMLSAHARLARQVGVDADQIILAENGTVVELTDDGPAVVGRVGAGMTFVDGLGVGDVKDVALRDRRHLSEHGVLIVVATLVRDESRALAPPEVIARGLSELEDLVDETRDEADEILRACLADGAAEHKLIQEHLHDELGRFLADRTGRRPMILPIVIEV
ncbi:MAG: ribonuclease J [Gaiellales bacterium]